MTASPEVQRLLAAYRDAAHRLQGLPIYNAALAVEAVGFREHDGRQVGVVVTPWFMNLTVLAAPGDLADWRPGHSTRLAFPSGRYDFTVGDAGAGELVATCSLFSPMQAFTEQAVAREAALAAVEALFERETPVPPPAPTPAPVFSRRKLFGG